MNYTITVCIYDGRVIEYSYECHAKTLMTAREVFETLSKGIKGYHKMWIIDNKNNKEERYSSVLADGCGIRCI